MARQFSLPFNIPPVQVFSMATDAAGRTGTYLSLKNAVKAWLVCEVEQGNAAQVTLCPLQASDACRTGSTAINSVAIYVDEDRAAASALTAQAAAASFQCSATTCRSKVVIFEIEPEVALDVANAFDCVTVQ